jgi:hypothetical protein
VLARARLPEGIAGITRLHALIGQFAGPHAEPGEVAVGIETDRGPVGDGAMRGWVCRLRNQPAAGGPVPGPAPHVGARMTGQQGSSAWTGSWTGAPDNPSSVSAVSAMTRGICSVLWNPSDAYPQLGRSLYLRGFPPNMDSVDCDRGAFHRMCR